MIKKLKWDSRLGSVATVLFATVGAKIRASKLLTKLIFKVNPYPKYRATHWDLCTLVSKKALDSHVKENHRVLEIGVSDLGILCLYLAKHMKNVDVNGVDINPDFVENATANAEKNNAKYNIFLSDLFSNVEGEFDIVFFNPPYNPRGWGKKHKKSLPNNPEGIWDGGDDGYDIIRKFLHDVPEYIKTNGKVLLGTTTFFHDDETLQKIFGENNLKSVSTVHSMLNPSLVYVLTKQ